MTGKDIKHAFEEIKKKKNQKKMLWKFLCPKMKDGEISLRNNKKLYQQSGIVEIMKKRRLHISSSFTKINISVDIY